MPTKVTDLFPLDTEQDMKYLGAYSIINNTVPPPGKDRDVYRLTGAGSLSLPNGMATTNDFIIYSGTEWLLFSSLSGINLNANGRRYIYTDKAGVTVLNALYTPPYVQVFKNGLLLTYGVDYTATDGGTVNLAMPLANNSDTVVIVCWSVLHSASSLYFGPLDHDPTEAELGRDIPEGAFYYNNKDHITKVYSPVVGWRDLTLERPSVALRMAYTYVADSLQTEFSGADVFSNTFDMLSHPNSPVIVLVNGVEMMEITDELTAAGIEGDYTLDRENSTVIFNQGLIASSVVKVKVLVDPNQVAGGEVKSYKVGDMLSLVDGVNTTFPLTKAVDATPIVVTDAEDVWITLDGVVQEPYIDFTIDVDGAVEFVNPPPVNCRLWAVWYDPQPLIDPGAYMATVYGGVVIQE